LKLEEEIAKQCLLANNKPKALIALRKKKFQENLLSKTDQQLETLQNLVSNNHLRPMKSSMDPPFARGEQINHLDLRSLTLLFWWTQVSSVEFSLIEKDVLFGLNQGNQILKEIHKELNIENVEKLMSETADSIAYQNVLSSFQINSFR
jgi:charged multivesicular body protein 6